MVSRIRVLLVVTIIFFSSTQLGFHFWPSSAFLYGLRVDYLSPTLYFLDLLIVLYLIIQLKIQHSLTINHWPLPILLVNLLFSHNPLASLSWSLHFLLYYSFVSSLSPIAIQYSLFTILPITLLFQIVLSLAQVLRGQSLQGLFYYLGERAFSLTSPNVAKGELFGELTLRSYGTFSHPNVLAGWSVVVLLILILLFRSRKKSSHPATYYLLLTTTIVSTIIFLTQSRSSALALFGLVIPFFLLKSNRPRVIYACLFLATCYLLLTTNSLGFKLEPSLGERLSLQATSLRVIRSFPVFGTGAQASISTYPLLSPVGSRGFLGLQPDHNSFTLFLSWFGLFGVLAILYSLSPYSIRHTLYSILPVAPILLLDHHLLTSPQGLFIILLYLKLTNFAKLNTHANH